MEDNEHILELVIMVAQHYKYTKMYLTAHLKMVKNDKFYLKRNRKKNPKVSPKCLFLSTSIEKVRYFEED